jgi:hypothetical protein
VRPLALVPPVDRIQPQYLAPASSPPHPPSQTRISRLTGAVLNVWDGEAVWVVQPNNGIAVGDILRYGTGGTGGLTAGLCRWGGGSKRDTHASARPFASGSLRGGCVPLPASRALAASCCRLPASPPGLCTSGGSPSALPVGCRPPCLSSGAGRGAGTEEEGVGCFADLTARSASVRRLDAASVAADARSACGQGPTHAHRASH